MGANRQRALLQAIQELLRLGGTSHAKDGKVIGPVAVEPDYGVVERVARRSGAAPGSRRRDAGAGSVA